jgi:hypothetical protein
MGAPPGTSWAASPDEAEYATKTGKGWTVLIGSCDRGLGRSTPMTRERAVWHLDRIREEGRVDAALGLLWENRTPDGARWWEWVVVDDGWGRP